MNAALMFLPLSPKGAGLEALSTEEFVEEMSRYGVHVPELDDGQDYHALELPAQNGFGGIEEEVWINIVDGNVLAAAIETPQKKGQLFWWQLLQLGFVLFDVKQQRWFVSANWATQQQRSGKPHPKVNHYSIAADAKALSDLDH